MAKKDFTKIINETKEIVLSAIGKHLAARFSHAIDDVAQEVYYRAYRSLMKNKFRGDSSLSTWIYTIARNESLRMNRKLAREEEKVQKAINAINEEPDTVENNDNMVEELYEKIALLPDIYRSVLELVLRGQNYQQISGSLNIKHGTVKSRASRARELLKEMYNGD